MLWFTAYSNYLVTSKINVIYSYTQFDLNKSLNNTEIDERFNEKYEEDYYVSIASLQNEPCKPALTLMELIIKYNEHQMVLLKHLSLAWKQWHMSEASRYPYNERGGKLRQKSPYNTLVSTDWTFFCGISIAELLLKLNNVMLYIYLYSLVIILPISSECFLINKFLGFCFSSRISFFKKKILNHDFFPYLFDLKYIVCSLHVNHVKGFQYSSWWVTDLWYSICLKSNL